MRAASLSLPCALALAGCNAILGLDPATNGDGDGVGVDARDGAIDAPDAPDAPEQDVDGDGIADEHDNCPVVENPRQDDEDGDQVGDACDNCPHVANAEQTNSDTSSDDDLGDACDPYPGLPGDRLIFFDGFNGADLAAEWTADAASWTVEDGMLVQANSVATRVLRLELSGVDHLSAPALVTAISPGTRGVAASLDYLGENNCALCLWRATAAGGHEVVAYRAVAGNPSEAGSATATAVAPGNELTITVAATATSQTCNFTGPTTAQFLAPYGLLAGGRPALRTNNLAAHFRYAIALGRY